MSNDRRQAVALLLDGDQAGQQVITWCRAPVGDEQRDVLVHLLLRPLDLCKVGTGVEA